MNQLMENIKYHLVYLKHHVEQHYNVYLVKAHHDNNLYKFDAFKESVSSSHREYGNFDRL